MRLGNDADIIKNLAKYKKALNITDMDENSVLDEKGEAEGLLKSKHLDLYERLQQLEKKKEDLENKSSQLAYKMEYGFNDPTEDGI